MNLLQIFFPKQEQDNITINVDGEVTINATAKSALKFAELLHNGKLPQKLAKAVLSKLTPEQIAKVEAMLDDGDPSAQYDPAIVHPTQVLKQFYGGQQ